MTLLNCRQGSHDFDFSGAEETNKSQCYEMRLVDARRRLAYTGNSTAVNASRTSLPRFSDLEQARGRLG